MKILVVQESDWLERNPHQQHHLMDRMDARGHQIKVIDYPIDWPKDTENKGLKFNREVHNNVCKVNPHTNITVIRPSFIKIKGLNYASLYFSHKSEIEKQIKEFQPDVIVGLGLLNSYTASKLAKKYNIPFVYYLIDNLYALIPEKIFQGLGKQGLRFLEEAGEKENLITISEVVESGLVEEVAEHVDILQVGARNMHNYYLLKELGKTTKPILLKRGIAATIEEWLMAAEYIMAGGNYNVILCERGIRTFENYTRNTLDISAIPVIKKRSHLPIIVDPSHATGIREKVAPMARAAIAAGADGLIIEVHHNPNGALSDGPQSLYPEQFETLMKECREIANVIGKKIR